MAVARDPPRCGPSCGCDANHQASYARWKIGGEELRTCPRWLVSEASLALMRLYAHYDAGHLPHSGGLLDQPNAYVEAMDIIRREVNTDHDG